jgi:hypothetical protein
MNKSPVTEWHQAVESMDPSILRRILAKECIFYSPILFKPQKGKALTKMYLMAAFRMFEAAGDFRYVKTVEQGDCAVLEFNATIDGIIVDGIDMLTWDKNGKITEFKVMLRPFKAIEMVGNKMKEQLENLSALDKLKVKASGWLERLA